MANVRNDGIAATPAPAVYVPASLFQRSSSKLFVRTSSDPLRLAAAVRQVIREVNPDQPISEITTMQQVVSETIAQPRFFTLLLAMFGALAVILAALGVYGVISYAATQRTHEVGIRMAVGARAADVLGLIIAQGMALALTGLIVGLVAASAATRALSSLLYGVTACFRSGLAAARRRCVSRELPSCPPRLPGRSSDRTPRAIAGC